MRVVLLVLLAVLSACARADKMPWPAPPSESLDEHGQGGALEEIALPPLPLVREPAEPIDVAELAVELPPEQLVFTWPIPATGINSLFGYRVDPIDGSRRFHAGIDLDGAYGELVRASAPGLVVKAGWASGHGRSVVIEHAGGFRTVYSHLAQLFVSEGALVEGRTVIGRLGTSGRSTGPHLHFELSRWGQHLDPLDLLGDAITVSGR